MRDGDDDDDDDDDDQIKNQMKHDRQNTCNVTLRRVRVATVAVKEQ